MDIAFVTTRLVDRDAQGNFSAATLLELKRRCNGRVTLFTFAYERPPIDGIEVRYLGGKNCHSLRTNLAAALHTFRLAKELAAYDRLLLAGPDIGALPAMHLAQRRNPGMKLIWVFHGLTPPEYLNSAADRLLLRLRRRAYLASMRRSGLVKTDSEYTRAELAGQGIDPAKIVAMPIGIDLSRFTGADAGSVRASLGAGDRFLLLFVGRLASGKRVDNLLRAMAILKDMPVMLAVVGGGEELERLVALAAELGLENVVRFVGRVDDERLPGYYAACDAWVTASEHEGFCVPIVEAMAAGRPVVVPDITAMPETAGGAGLTYRHGDVGELAVCIRRLMSDRELYGRLAGNAKAGAARFGIACVMPAYLELVAKKEDDR